ncbi:MAG: NAD-glutamate dehydrogenase [Geminicoccaceae bacterium]
MSVDPKARKAKILAEVEARIRERVAAKEVERTVDFVNHYYAGVATEDLAARDPMDLYGAALAHLASSEKRKPGQAVVRVYNPELERDGWQSTHTMVEVVTSDMPFLVDSVSVALSQKTIGLHLIIHPIVAVRRTKAGNLQAIQPRAEDGFEYESLIRIEIDRQAEERLERLEQTLIDVLADVAAAVRDWKPMLARVDNALADIKRGAKNIAADDADEISAFIEWMREDHFTFIGYGAYTLKQNGEGPQLFRDEESALGVATRWQRGVKSQTFAMLPPSVRERATDPTTPLIVTKANTKSTVHRRTYLDYVGVKRYNRTGKVVGEHRFFGLFTSVAYNRSPREIPLLRRKVERVLQEAGLRSSSHDGKALINILETYPRDELLQSDFDTLFRTAIGILHLQDRQLTRLFMRHDPFGRFTACLVYTPRERYSTALRARFEDILKDSLGGTDVQFETKLSDEVLARVLFIVRTPKDSSAPEVDVSVLQDELIRATRSWEDHLKESLIDACGEGEGNRLFQTYGTTLPVGYQESLPARAAVTDIEFVDSLDKGKTDLAMRLYRPIEPGQDLLRFRLIQADNKIPLSTALPILENMGLAVIDEHPASLNSRAGRMFWLHDFGALVDEGAAVDPLEVRDLFQQAFASVWRGEVENDGLNRLVLLAGLSVRQVAVLRAYCKYLLQIKIPFSQTYIEDTLSHHPRITQSLTELFKARFDPTLKGDRDKAQTKIFEAIGADLDQVVIRDEDIIIRALREVMVATVRTNAFQRDEDGKPKDRIALKVDPTQIRLMPEPRPFAEIWVYSSRVEGIHLRGGSVARGGLRWSDRREDFRTEVLALMKAQQVKNSVIVPVGAKGGFVVKHPPKGGDRAAFIEEGVACYRTFLSGLLDVTDNRTGEGLSHPHDVVRHDPDDPYLVVAADKGTATFSDIANELAKSYGFWLGDGFASGGSAGYDHKGMGITAKGAWESVKRHFHDMGRDCQTEPFTVVGVGDMSGDVFGNGMLLSRQIRLVAAFDHRNVFLDPDPDPEISFVERERLFKLPRSSWEDYDVAKISEGGGIYPRSAKSIAVSAEMRAVLGIEEETLAPSELIRAIIKAPVDLFWNGGIGTYVKASTERHAEAEDRANDAVRADATELRCKVIGEGGNLGVTQKGRIEFAMHGGRVNTDFIDNSAGVDCSDHEVNIKILLDGVVKAGDMTEKQRNTLLAKMTDEVSDLCLADNIQQNFCLSVTQAMPLDIVDSQLALMRRLEGERRLDRALSVLPDDESLSERRQADLGLTRPELSELMAHAKNALYTDILASDLPDEPHLEGDLIDYFPKPLAKQFAPQIKTHQLRREIIATTITNSLVNIGLDVMVGEIQESTGRETPDIARAFMIARDAFELDELWQEIQALAPEIDAAEQIGMLKRCRSVAVQGTAWFLTHLPRDADIAQAVARFEGGVDTVLKGLEKTLDTDQGLQFKREIEGACGKGVNKKLSRKLTALPYALAACDIVEVSNETGCALETTANVYFSLSGRLGLERIHRRLSLVPVRNRWDRRAIVNLADDLNREQRRLTAAILRSVDGRGTDQAGVEAWLEGEGMPYQRVRRIWGEMESASGADLAMMSVALRSLGDLGGQAIAA